MPRIRFCALILSTIFVSLLPAGSTSADSLVVQTCGTLPLAYQAGATRLDTVDVNGNKCTNAGSAGIAQKVEITDPAGDGPANVKPASTAAVATDPSVVFQLNPLSPGIIALGPTTKSGSVPTTFATDQYADPCMNPLIAKTATPINITAAATNLLVPVSGSTAIYVCAMSFTVSEVVTTPNTLQFEYGTGASCTGANKLTGLFGGGGVTAGDPILVHAGFGGTLFTAPASNALCALTAIGATGSFQGFMSYVQQ